MNVIILHGTGDKPTDFWFPYLQKNLEKRGYSIWLPELPNNEKPNLKDWLSFVLEHGVFTKDTILIGHSAGAQLILSILERIEVKIRKAILVSGYAESLIENPESQNHPELNWEKIKSHVDEIIFINSDNDPWGCNDEQGKIMFNNLGGILIIRHEGHMGSTKFNQPYKEFPLLLKLIS